MAMIKCKECNQAVSNTAPTCPHCGAIVKKPKKKAGCGSVLVLLFILFIGLSMFATGEFNNYKTNTPAATKTKIPAPTLPPPSAEERWNAHSTQSPIDDSTNIYLRRASNNTLTNALGQNYHANLHIRCKENTTSIIIDWEEFLSTQAIPVLTRIDKQPATTTEWGISTDYQSIGKWSGLDAIPYIQKLTGGKTLLIQVTPHAESPITAKFDISDLKDALTPLRNECGW